MQIAAIPISWKVVPISYIAMQENPANENTVRDMQTACAACILLGLNNDGPIPAVTTPN